MKHRLIGALSLMLDSSAVVINPCALTSTRQLRASRLVSSSSTFHNRWNSITNFSSAAAAMPQTGNLLFRQLFEKESSTYTYLLACMRTKEAILIDPVLETVDRDVEQIESLGLTLKYGVNTHCHADHVTGTMQLKSRYPAMKSVISGASHAKADVLVAEGDRIEFGDQALHVFSTPGHTNGCVTLTLPGHDLAFTGDALLIRGCGRTDFQEGDAACLYESVHSKILSLPPHTQLYPAHDYKGRTVTTVEEELKFNPRLTKSKAEFIEIMNNLGLPYPQKIDISVPANLQCGVYDVPKA